MNQENISIVEKPKDDCLKKLASIYKSRASQGLAKKTLFVGPGITEDKMFDMKIWRDHDGRLFVLDDSENKHEVFVCDETKEGKKEYLVLPVGTVLNMADNYFNPFPISGIKSFVNADCRTVEGVVLELGKKYNISANGSQYKVTSKSKGDFKITDISLSHWQVKNMIFMNLPGGESSYLGGNTTNAARSRANLLKSLSLEDHTHLIVGAEQTKDYPDRFQEQKEHFGFDTSILPLPNYGHKNSIIIKPIIMGKNGIDVERYLDRFVMSERTQFVSNSASNLKDIADSYLEGIVNYVDSHSIGRLVLSSFDNSEMIRLLPRLIRRLRADNGETFEVYLSPSNTFQSTIGSIARMDPDFCINSYYTELLNLIDSLVFNREEAELLGDYIWTDTEKKSLLSDESSPQKLVRFLSGKTRGKSAIATFGDSGIWLFKRCNGSTKETNNLEADYLIWGNNRAHDVVFTLGAGDAIYGVSTVGADLGMDQESRLLLCLLASQYKISGSDLYDHVGSFSDLRLFERKIYELGNVGELRRSETVHFPKYIDKYGQQINRKNGSQERIENPISLFKRLDDHFDVHVSE